MKTKISVPPAYRPLIQIALLAVVSYLGYYGARGIASQPLRQGLASIAGTFYFISIFFGPLYIYTRAYLEGLPLVRRVLLASLIPFIWMSKDILVMLESHPLLECLYWYFNPLYIWLVCLMVGGPPTPRRCSPPCSDCGPGRRPIGTGGWAGRFPRACAALPRPCPQSGRGHHRWGRRPGSGAAATSCPPLAAES